MEGELLHPPQYCYDLLSERALLKIALHGDDQALRLCGRLTPSIWDTRHALLASALSKMHSNGMGIDMVSTLNYVIANSLVTQIDGPFLHSVYSGPGDHDGVLWYAERIREMAARRHLIEASERVKQGLEYGWTTGCDLTVRAALKTFREGCDGVEEFMSDSGTTGPRSMAQFLDGPMDCNWIIPGLLEHHERLLLTGSEGHGKSYLVSQLAASMAGSVHPFSSQVLGDGSRGIRVAVFDCENSEVQSRRRFTRIVHQVDTIRRQRDLPPADWSTQLYIDIRPAGLNLLNPRDVGWLDHAISATAPDLVTIGPLYKLFDADPSDEQAVRHVVAEFDSLRARYGFALMIEAHSPKADDGSGSRRVDPIGSSVWLRWPEYGFGIRRAKGDRKRRPQLMDVVAWRGTREERQWPEQIRYGTRLPWEAVDQIDEPS